MVTAVAEQVVPPKPRANGGYHPPIPRRFDIPDIDRTMAWFLPRFMQVYPHLAQAQALSFIRSVVYSNEFLFLYQEHAVALAQSVNEHTLQPKPMIWERFVFCADPQNPQHVAEAATFYTEFKLWAIRKGVEAVVVRAQSDVPDEIVHEYFPHITLVEMQIARV